MSVQGLQNPYERLQVLPTTMNWRGAWLVTQTYFKNDVVISPANGASYILANQTALNGGPDPSLNAEFVELSPLSTGVQGITAGTAIGVDNTNPSNPVISNNGVRTVNGDGVTVVVDNTDPNNPVISSNSITVLQAGGGITVDNTNPQIPVIGNSGVRQILAADASVNISNPTGIVTISANGLVSVTEGVGIQITGTPQNPEIASTGVLTLLAGEGIQSSGGTNPTVNNTGVLSVAPVDSSIIVSGTAQNVQLRTAAPVLTRVFNSTWNAIPQPPVLPGANKSLSGVTPGSPSNIFTNYLANGAPDATGIFMIDMTAFLMIFAANGAPQVVQNVVYVSFFDSVLNKEYVSATILNNFYLTIGEAYPLSGALGLVYFNVADARTAGLRTLNGILIHNTTNGTMAIQSGPTTFNGTYYPLGLQ